MLQHLASCRKKECKKNHVKYQHDTTSGEDWAVIHLEHWKNEYKKGGLDIKVKSGLGLQVLDMMERASKALHKSCMGLVFSAKHPKKQVYSEKYFTTLLKRELSPAGKQVNYLDVRHKWVTIWADYVDQAELQGGDVTATMLKDAAAALVGNSVVAWERNYDAKSRSRGVDRVAAHYPCFRRFVKEQHAIDLGQISRDPTTGRVS